MASLVWAWGCSCGRVYLKKPLIKASFVKENKSSKFGECREEDGDFDNTAFQWNHFVLAGDLAKTRADAKGNIEGDMLGCPDGLWVDGRGVLWVQADMSTGTLGKGDLQRMGNNPMLAADPKTGKVRRFLVGPVACEITGATSTPGGRTLFFNSSTPANAAKPQRHASSATGPIKTPPADRIWRRWWCARTMVV